MADVKPLSPKDLKNNIENVIPSVVIEAVNNLLKENYYGKSITITQKALISEIIKLDDSMTSTKLLNKNWLDFEPLFRKNGWNVAYRSPDRDENFDPHFVFTPAK